MSIFKIPTNNAETFMTINDVRMLIDKADGTANGLDYYMVYCKEGKGLYYFCADITCQNGEILCQYHSDKEYLDNSLIYRGKPADIDRGYYRSIINITTIFKLEHGLK